MTFDVVLLPRDLQPADLAGRAVVVFDVLRATTTMAAALAAGVGEIRVFDRLDAAREAAAAFDGAKLLCGEEACLPPKGFDLGNSPGAFTKQAHAGRTAFMCTTNGTRALVAARAAEQLFVGALVNASATARQVGCSERDVTLLCAGTNGRIAMEDVLGAAAVGRLLQGKYGYEPASDVVRIAEQLYRSSANDLRAALGETQGGRNVERVGLSADIDFAARVDSIHLAGRVTAGERGGLVVRTAEGSGG